MSFPELYSEKILEIAGNPVATPRLANPSASARKVSRVCGSSIEVDVAVEDGIITGYGATVRACALGQTSAAIVAAHIVGSAADEMRGLRAAVAAMLKSDGAPPQGKWADLEVLAPVRAYPARHASTLLVFDAVAEALDRAGA